MDFILGYFDNGKLSARKMYQEFINASINIKQESPLKKTVASTILGSDNFVESIKDKYLDLHKGERNVPALKALKKSPDIEGIYNELKLHFNSSMLCIGVDPIPIPLPL